VDVINIIIIRVHLSSIKKIFFHVSMHTQRRKEKKEKNVAVSATVVVVIFLFFLFLGNHHKQGRMLR